MLITKTELSGVKIIEPKVYSDARGLFFESFQAARYKEAGIDLTFVQDNISRSSQGVLRGLHYQLQHQQGKLVTVLSGEIFDVVVDVRFGSPTFGKWIGLILSGQNHKQLYIPPGFAHGFCVLSQYADFHYKCTDYYHPEDEQGVIWNDKNIAINWPLKAAPILSTKDSAYKNLADIKKEFLPAFLPSERNL